MFFRAVVGVLLTLGWFDLPIAVGQSTELGSDLAGELTRQAFEAEIRGEPATRQRLLLDTVAAHPQYQPAQSQLGKLKLGNQWISASDYQKQFEENSRYQQYLAMRSGAEHNLRNHVDAAKWCRRYRLNDEEQFHWRAVLSFDAKHAEALRALGLQWFEGELLSRDEIAQRAASAKRRAAERRYWAAVLQQLTNEQGGALDGIPLGQLADLPQLEPAGCLSAIESELLGRDQQQESLAVKMLQRIHNPESTDLLVHVAMFSTHSDVRQQAIDVLKQRKLHSFAPQLLQALQNPFETDFRLYLDGQDKIQYQHELTRETPDRNQVVFLFGHADLYRPFSGTLDFLLNSRRPLIIQNRARREGIYPSFAHRQFVRFAEFGAQIEQEVETANQQIKAINARVANVLTQVVGQDHGPQPKDWWRWWNQFNELTLPSLKPDLQPFQVIMASCFPVGTKVWTKRGNVPIEEVIPGDFVFAQDVESGEITIKPVLATTLRNPTGTIRFQVNNETICATRGHPLWVSGDGWRMVKLVETGQHIRTMRGSTRVQSVEPGEPAPAFNLIVDDHHNYFVGESAVLVHDNTYRSPTRAVVPGYRPQ